MKKVLLVMAMVLLTSLNAHSQDYTETIKTLKMYKAMYQEDLKFEKDRDLINMYNTEIRKINIQLKRYGVGVKESRKDLNKIYYKPKNLKHDSKASTKFYYEFMTRRGDTVNIQNLPFEEWKEYIKEYNNRHER